MIEYVSGSLIYAAAKDVINVILKRIKESPENYKENDKLIDSKYIERSNLKNNLEANGYKLGWVKLDKIHTKKLDGYEIVYEIDKENKLKNRLVNSSKQILLMKLVKKT